MLSRLVPTKPKQTVVEKKKKDSPGEHGWCWQEDHSVRSDRLQPPSLNQVQLAMSSPGDDIDGSEDENVKDVKDIVNILKL